MNYRYFLSGQDELLRRVLAFFTARTLDPALYTRIQEFRKNNSFLASQIPGFNALVSLGHLTPMDFMVFENEYAQKRGIPTTILDWIIARMCEVGIHSIHPFFSSGPHRAYALDENLTKFLGERDCITNLMFGFSFIAEKYQDSVFKIVVRDQEGNQHIGTGFLYGFIKHNRVASLVITNQHVAQYEDGLILLDNSNNELAYNKILRSKNKDLAVIELAEEQNRSCFNLFEQPEVLDEVITIGYPSVAMTRSAYQLVHKGEINSIVRDHGNNELILFSAKTAPGNSGGPLVNRLGMVVGVVSQELYYKDALVEKGQLPYYAAIPASEVRHFINSEYLS